jgi:hypothetical protein
VYDMVQTKIRSALTRLHAREYKDSAADASNLYLAEAQMQKMPIVTFTHLNAFLENTNTQIEALLEVLASNIDTAKCTLTQGERLVDMCTSLPRALLHAHDASRSSNGGQIAIDAWASLRMSPALNAAEFDAREGAQLVMSIVCGLRMCELSATASTVLRAMQEHARRFTPFFAFGTIRIGPGAKDLAAHMHVIMLDARWVETRRGDARSKSVNLHFASLCMEATAYVSGEWNKYTSASCGDTGESATPTSLQMRAVRTAMDRILLNSGHADTGDLFEYSSPINVSNAIVSMYCRPYTPNSDTYHEVSALVSPHHGTGTGHVIHGIITDGRTIGASVHGLHRYILSVNMHVVVDQTRADFNKLHQCLWKQDRAAPSTQSHTSFSISARARKMNVVAVLCTSEQDWNAHTDAYSAIFAALDATGEFWADTSEPAPRIAGGVSMKRIYITNTAPLQAEFG